MSLRIFSYFSEKLLKRNLDSENTPPIVNCYNIRIKLVAILIAALLAFSCGGGGGGGGMVAFAPSEGGTATPHNGGDAGGWGTGNSTGNGFNPQGQGIEEAEAGLLISQMAALSDITGVTIELTINGTPYPAINADATTTTAVLPKIKAGDKISGKATINLMDAQPRIAYLDETEATLHGVLKFKVPYKYTVLDGLDGNQLDQGEYFAREGVHLETLTTPPITGWKCINDNTKHFGGLVAGVRGDITLVPLYGSGEGLNAQSDKTILYAKPDASFNDVATVTISGGSGAYSVTPDSSSASLVDCTGSGSSWTLSIKNDTTTPNSTGKVMFADNTGVTINVTDTLNNETASVSIMLKNKYSLEVDLTYPDNYGGYTSSVWNASTTFNAGDTFDLSTISFSSVPAGRQIVAYKHIHPDTTATTIYKTTTTPPDTFTFSSALGRRNVYLSAVLDFTCSRSDGGYGTTASPLNSQNGTSTNPYLLNYYGNDTNKRNQIELEISNNNCANNALTIEPAPAQTAILSATFDITHTGNKFLIKIKPTLAENSVYTSNTIKLTITDPTTGAKKDIHVLLKKVIIGNKPAPDAVGDIVFNDGSAMSYTDFNNLDAATKNEKKAAAIAVIFYAGGNANLGNRALGLGINSYNGTDYSGTPLGSSAKGRLYYIGAIKSEPHYSAQASNIDVFINLISGDVDGSDNFSVMASYFTSNGMTNDTETSGKYPAFQWPRDSYPGTRSNLTGTPYATGWYLPTLPEMLMIYKNKGTVEAALAACGSGVNATLPGGEYWTFSASTADDHNHNALTLFNMSTGVPNWDDGWQSKKILAIRRFN